MADCPVEEPSAWLWCQLAEHLGPEQAADLQKRFTAQRAAYTAYAAERRVMRQTRRLIARLADAERAGDTQTAKRARKALRTHERRQIERNL